MSVTENTQKCPNCTEVVPLEYSICPFCGFGLLEYELKKFSYKPSLREIFVRLISFYRHPVQTSEEMSIATETRGTNIVILLFSLLLSLRFYFLVIKAGYTFSTKIAIPLGKGQISLGLGFILFLLSIVLIPLMVWIIYKLLFSFGSWLISKFANILGSELSTKQVRTILGYSIVPVVVGEFIGIFFVLISPGGKLGDTGNISYADVANYVTTIYTSGPLFIYRFIMVAFWLVTAIYLLISFRHAGKMAWFNAFLASFGFLGLFVYMFYLLGI
ncbi:MAG: hypothetical protein ACTSYD_09465 [Candidatus Heimdallarchaeaceae archaeon]